MDGRSATPSSSTSRPRSSEALVTGDRSALDLRGFGVTSVVLAAPTGAPTAACKRVPPFRDRATFERYRDVVLHNIDELRASGVDVVETEVRLVEQGGRLVGYVVQPLLDPLHPRRGRAEGLDPRRPITRWSSPSSTTCSLPPPTAGASTPRSATGRWSTAACATST